MSGSDVGQRVRHQLAWVVGLWAPPVARREFWLVQLLVVAIAGGHSLLDLRWFGLSDNFITPIPSTLFLVPVVYAALNFGLRGSVPTALWGAFLTVPNLVWLQIGSRERLSEEWEIMIVVALAFFVGRRVDEEKRARHEAESREQAQRVSEEKFRGVFDHVAEPILLGNSDGVIEEANLAAARIFGAPSAALHGQRLASLVGADILESEIVGIQDVRPLNVAGQSEPIWIEPIVIPYVDQIGATRLQVMLRDVTLRHVRQQELEDYARQVVAGREAERGRIARELHDGPIQSLVILWRKLDSISDADGAAQATIQEAQRTTRSIADELRRFSRDLRPSVLDDLGLKTALAAQVDMFGQRTGTTARFQSTGSERRLSSDQELALLRIAQEALSNIDRHAEANNAVVRLRFWPDKVRLTVIDDGKGIPAQVPASELRAAGKLGLIGMQERARLARATLSIVPGRRGGTRITADVTG